MYFDVSSQSNTEGSFFDVLGGKEESQLSSKHQNAHHSHHEHNLVESSSVHIIAHIVNAGMKVVVEVGQNQTGENGLHSILLE